MLFRSRVQGDVVFHVQGVFEQDLREEVKKVARRVARLEESFRLLYVLSRAGLQARIRRPGVIEIDYVGRITDRFLAVQHIFDVRNFDQYYDYLCEAVAKIVANYAKTRFLCEPSIEFRRDEKAYIVWCGPAKYAVADGAVYVVRPPRYTEIYKELWQKAVNAIQSTRTDLTYVRGSHIIKFVNVLPATISIPIEIDIFGSKQTVNAEIRLGSRFAANREPIIMFRDSEAILMHEEHGEGHIKLDFSNTKALYAAIDVDEVTHTMTLFEWAKREKELIDKYARRAFKSAKS